jgi:hypothetical protein
VALADMIDIFVCTNEVNYTVALGELRRHPRPSLLVFDPFRCDTRPARRVWQMPLGPWADRIARNLGRLGLLGTAHVPHLRFRPRLLREVQRARRIAYLDDGLDTLRRVPQNIDLTALPAQRARFLTFSEYRELPQWLQAFDVRKVCSLRDLAHAGDRTPIDLARIDHLFIESPGLDAGELIAALGVDPQRTLCVRHPVPHKRGTLPALCASVEGRGHDLEATLLAARDIDLYFGSTMAAVFALVTEASTRNRIHVQLDDPQHANLVLPGRFEIEPVTGLRHPLRRALAPVQGALTAAAQGN